MSAERVQKVLARAGLASRRVVEDMIVAGRVTVNGRLAQLGDRADPAVDVIEVDGAVISVLPDAITYLVNKPAGVITTVSDPHGRPTVVQLVPDQPRVFPVGRLDADTEGLLLLTNDGTMAHQLTHPSHGVDKEYLAHVQGRPKPSALRALRQGVALDDGVTAPAKVALVSPDVIRLTIHEGRNRQVRRMCEAIGHPVLRLIRTRIGPLVDARLEPGHWRVLTADEVLQLQRSVNRSAPPPRR